MAELEKAKRKRAVIRGLTTKLIQSIEQEMAEHNVSVNVIEEKLSHLSIKETELKTLDENIERDISNLDDLETEILGSQEYQEKIVSVRHKAIKKLHGNEQGMSRRSTESETYSRSTIKLPPLTLNKFNGDPTRWQGFWCQFETAVHQNPDLQRADKFNYLKSYLEGTAANVVNGFTFSSENYDSAISMLQERFGRKDVLVNAHMNRLLSLNPIKRSQDIIGLRRLYDECEVQIRNLTSLGVVTETYGSLLCPILLKLIPDDIALDFSKRRERDKEWNVSELIRFLQLDIEGRERAVLLSKPSSETLNPEGKSSSRQERSQHGESHRGKKAHAPSTSALNAVTQNSKCAFCLGDTHSTENCPKFNVTERREKVKDERKCFICLNPSHIAKFCKKKYLRCSNCKGKHHRSLCMTETADSSDTGGETVVSSVAPTPLPPTPGTTVLLQTAQVRVRSEGEGGGRGREMTARCLMDSGSQRSFIREDISRSLNLPIVGEETLNIFTFGNKTPIQTRCRRVKGFLTSFHDKTQTVELELLESPEICCATVSIPGKELTRELSEKGLELADHSTNLGAANDSISILIGSENYWRVATGRVERISESLLALETKFGWTIHGPTSVHNFTISTISVNKEIVNETEILSQELRAFWEIESLGITDNASSSECSQIEAVHKFDSTIKFRNDRYEVELPWKDDKPVLPDNYEVAKGRLLNLGRRFKQNPSLYERYQDVISEQLKDGIVEYAPSYDEATRDQERVVYYLPHHAVIRDDRLTSKLRIVFDASSHDQGCPSLNECLLAGPNLNPNILTILLKFRTHNVAFTADIERAFHQIALAEEDRDAVRFLWFEEPPTGTRMPNIIELRMTRVIFGATSSPFLLAATIRHHLKQHEASHPLACKLLTDSLYVDDLISGAENETEALKLKQETTNLLDSANMNLRKWRSNSKVFQENPTDRAGEVIEIVNTDKRQTNHKVLGLGWNTDTDRLEFDITSLLKFLIDKKDTKRNVLQATARLFDPMGFLSPFSIRIKCLFQVLWERGIDWDRELPDDLKTEWNNWNQELTKLQDISVPRCLFSDSPRSPEPIQIHCFSDASERAYGAVVYVRYRSEGAEFKSNLVMSKARVSPLKRISLPRLELLGALLAARIYAQVKETISNCTRTFMWTDSMIVYHWIKGDTRRWKQFVSNRINEIQSLTDPSTWNHCPGVDNPADLLTRGQTIERLKSSTIWWQGPHWLKEDEMNWPKPVQDQDVLRKVESELRKTEVVVQNNCTTPDFEPLLNLENYSTVQRVFRTTAWIRRFVSNCKVTQPKLSGPLNEGELWEAERYWIKIVQQQEFRGELTLLASKQPLKGSKIQDLQPYMDEDGLLRARSRLQEANLKTEEKQPYILPTKTRLTELLVRAAHGRLMHAGLNQTLAQLRERYWIVRGRRSVNSVLSKCKICKRYSAKPATSSVAPLPKDRIIETPPFETSGADYAGPLIIKDNGTTRKAYILLITCAVTRAVHLELVPTLETSDFLLAFRRFVARRGACKTLYSDNARTFKRADKDLRTIWNNLKNEELLNYFGAQGIRFKFIVERACWWGGFWERLVKSVKTCLRKSLGRACLTYVEMETTLAEVEAIINSRPLTFVSDDLQNESPLTPAHFLTGNRLTCLPPKHRDSGDAKISNATKRDLTRRLKYREKLLNTFWTRWKKEYLLELRSAHHYPNGTGNSTTLKVNDLVLIQADKAPRHLWKIGRITETFYGRDKNVRACMIRLPGHKFIRRPVQLLYPVETTD